MCLGFVKKMACDGAKEFCCDYVYHDCSVMTKDDDGDDEQEKKKMMSKEEARVEIEKLECLQKKKAMVIWHADILIMLLEGRLRTFGSLTEEELKKLDENRRRKAFMERGYAWGRGRIAALLEFEAGCGCCCDV